MGFFKQNIAIDLGTATVLVSVGDKGVVIKEPSIVAVKEGTNEVIAIGEEARLMMGRTPFDIKTVRPVQNGVISSYTITRKMIAYYLNKAITNPIARKFKPDVLVCIPSNTTNVEKRAVYQAAMSAGAGRVFGRGTVGSCGRCRSGYIEAYGKYDYRCGWRYYGYCCYFV